jgi:hypothetical protein
VNPPTNPLTAFSFALHGCGDPGCTMYAVRVGDVISPNGVDKFVVTEVDGHKIDVRRTFGSWLAVTLRVLAWKARWLIARVWR